MIKIGASTKIEEISKNKNTKSKTTEVMVASPNNCNDRPR